LPNRRQFRRYLTLVFQKFFNGFAPLDTENIRFILETFEFNLKSDDIAVQRFELVRLALLRDPDSGGCLVDEVNRLIGKIPIRDVTGAVDRSYDANKSCGLARDDGQLILTCNDGRI
jgi:hypothetical protein